jgi:hypothetical protein
MEELLAFQLANQREMERVSLPAIAAWSFVQITPFARGLAASTLPTQSCALAAAAARRS